MNVRCYCGAGFQTKKPGLLLLEVTQFCSPGCLKKYIIDHRKEYSTPIESTPLDYTPLDPSDVWDSVTETYYRSWFEVHVARFLLDIGEEFQYEPATIKVGRKRNYTPDFWLPRCQMFLEVKGLWGSGAKSKTRTAVKEGRPIVLVPAHLANKFARKYKLPIEGVRR